MWEDIPEDDARRHFPRFQKDNFEHNMELVKEVEKVAATKGCKVSQVAIAWVKAQSTKPGMPRFIPIPGATTVARVEENNAIVDLTDTELEELSVAMQKCLVKGDRYPGAVGVFNFGDSPEE